MKAVIQRVSHASVDVDNTTVGKIGHGYLIFLGVMKNDTEEEVKKLASKIINLRIFSDENGKTNRSVLQVDGSALIISQFTLCANCKHGNRPDFLSASPAKTANALYESFISEMGKSIKKVEHGIFGADMKVSLCNDGPFTILLDTDEL